jgi:hypothetical protein
MLLTQHSHPAMASTIPKTLCYLGDTSFSLQKFHRADGPQSSGGRFPINGANAL